MKGKDMILSDFLSWQNRDDSNPCEIIPISFNTYKILEDNRNFDKCNKIIDNTSAHETYLIQTHSQAKSGGTRFPEVHGVQKELDPNLRPEKQHTISKQGKLERPQVGQGRAGLRRGKPDPINQPTNQPLDMTQGILKGTKIETGKTNNTQGTNSTCDRSVNNNNNPFSPDVPHTGIHSLNLQHYKTQIKVKTVLILM